jgi:hypothetical protein
MQKQRCFAGVRMQHVGGGNPTPSQMGCAATSNSPSPVRAQNVPNCKGKIKAASAFRPMCLIGRDNFVRNHACLSALRVKKAPVQRLACPQPAASTREFAFQLFLRWSAPKSHDRCIPGSRRPHRTFDFPGHRCRCRLYGIGRQKRVAGRGRGTRVSSLSPTRLPPGLFGRTSRMLSATGNPRSPLTAPQSQVRRPSWYSLEQ